MNECFSDGQSQAMPMNSVIEWAQKMSSSRHSTEDNVFVGATEIDDWMIFFSLSAWCRNRSR